jgi:CPA2 family monovalent cation:H+ antiporter-2
MGRNDRSERADGKRCDVGDHVAGVRPAAILAAMHDLPLINTLAAGFAAAWLLGLFTRRLGLSPIVGYLLAGVLIGPYTPGFVGDIKLASQLAEVGVILLMFGVGLHFHLKDLLRVKGIAIPGAVIQSAVATGAAWALFRLFGWSTTGSLMLGFAMAVASTVVLMRVLMDNQALTTAHGHVAVGWLIVEDIFTVILLVLIPVMGAETAVGAATAAMEQEEPGSFWPTIGLALLKLIVFVGIVLVFGSRIVPWVLIRVAKLRSRELFTLTVLVLSIAVAAGASALFGASMALGAFLAGMVVGQSPVSHQAAADALPMRDAFAVLFFVSVGMLFDPSILIHQPMLVLAGLVVILIAKPVTALVVVLVLGYTTRTALTVALGLAQIGEFSFILSEVARHHGLLPLEGHNVLVAGALVSITLNPPLFRSLDRIEGALRARPRLWNMLNRRAIARVDAANRDAARDTAALEQPHAVIVGYGPVGQTVDAMLRELGITTVVVDMNMDTVQTLNKSDRLAIYGDAGRGSVLDQAGLKSATHLVVTLPESADRSSVVIAARELSAEVQILVRARYLGERDHLAAAGANATVFEEAESAIALARLVMGSVTTDAAAVDEKLRKVRRELLPETVTPSDAD